jgi:hypothetical protein
MLILEYNMEEFCYMWFVPLFLLTIVSLIGAIGCICAYYNLTETFAGCSIKNKMWMIRAILLFFFFVGGTSWIVYALNQPWRTIVSTYHEIKDVTYPDGTTVQMCSIDGDHINLTQKFGKIVDKDWIVHRTQYAKVYGGISFSCSDQTWRDYIYLEHKKDDVKLDSIEIIPDAVLEKMRRSK